MTIASSIAVSFFIFLPPKNVSAIKTNVFISRTCGDSITGFQKMQRKLKLSSHFCMNTKKRTQLCGVYCEIVQKLQAFFVFFNNGNVSATKRKGDKINILQASVLPEKVEKEPKIEFFILRSNCSSQLADSLCVVETKLICHSIRHLSLARETMDLLKQHKREQLANETDIVPVPRQLGHASITTTENFYSHIIKENKAKAADCITGVLIRRNA